MLQQQVDELICRRFYLTYHAAASRCYLQKNVYTVANVGGRSRPFYYFIVLEKVINLMSKSIIISLVKLFETCLIKIVQCRTKKSVSLFLLPLIGNKRVAVNFCDGSSFERYQICLFRKIGRFVRLPITLSKL